jgi:hypothetical protein
LFQGSNRRTSDSGQLIAGAEISGNTRKYAEMETYQLSYEVETAQGPVSWLIPPFFGSENAFEGVVPSVDFATSSISERSGEKSD